LANSLKGSGIGKKIHRGGWHGLGVKIRIKKKSSQEQKGGGLHRNQPIRAKIPVGGQKISSREKRLDVFRGCKWGKIDERDRHEKKTPGGVGGIINQPWEKDWRYLTKHQSKDPLEMKKNQKKKGPTRQGWVSVKMWV